MLIFLANGNKKYPLQGVDIQLSTVMLFDGCAQFYGQGGDSAEEGLPGGVVQFISRRFNFQFAAVEETAFIIDLVVLADLADVRGAFLTVVVVPNNESCYLLLLYWVHDGGFGQM
jgi:hypothetical protein